MDGDAPGPGAYDPYPGCAGGEVFMNLLADVCVAIVWRNDFDCKVGKAVVEASIGELTEPFGGDPVCIRSADEVAIWKKAEATFDSDLAEGMLVGKVAKRSVEAAGQRRMFSTNWGHRHHPPVDQLHLSALWRIWEREELVDRDEPLHPRHAPYHMGRGKR